LANYFEQLPKSLTAKEKLTAKIGVPIASIEAVKEWEALPDMQKLRLVESEIESSQEIGDVEYPGLWIKDELDVRSVSIDAAPEAVVFIGKKGRTYVLLIGSANHILGAVPASSGNLPMSYAYAFHNVLMKAVQLSDENSAEWLQAFTKLFAVPSKPPFFALDDQNLCTIMIYMHEHSRSIPMRVRFLGVRLWHVVRDEQGIGETPFILGSPLFIESL
jgi:hypothetical protein